MTTLDAALAAGRFAQYAGVSLAGGGALFQVYGPRSPGAPALVRLGALLGLAGIAGWLMAETGMVGEASDAFRVGQVWSVAADTGFGRAALVRGVLLALAGFATLQARWLPSAAAGLAAAASLAWSGHGAMDDDAAGVVHLAADAIHAAAAAVWTGALVVLVGLLGGQRETGAEGLRAFSKVGIWVVIAVLATGIVNSAYLIGVSGLPRLLDSLYGQLLVAKLALVALMLGLAAVNRWRLIPNLGASVGIETAAVLMVLALVAVMGAVSPPMMAMAG